MHEIGHNKEHFWRNYAQAKINIEAKALRLLNQTPVVATAE
jgi:hypothetical protein